MMMLMIGLMLFLGGHSIRILAEDWRRRRIAAMGEGRWKALFSVVAALGLALLAMGYGAARGEATQLWQAPAWTRHLTALLTLPAFVLLVAAYLPGSRIRAAVGHPMILGVKLWAFAHLLSNGGLADVVLFGSFLAWAAADFAAARRRDASAGVVRTGGSASRDIAVIVVGSGAWALFAWLVHGPLIGVQPVT